jgi:hypothetical protein
VREVPVPEKARVGSMAVGGRTRRVGHSRQRLAPRSVLVGPGCVSARAFGSPPSQMHVVVATR